MNILLAYIKILRPINMLLASLSVIITAYLTETLSKPTIVINSIIVVSLFVGASNILNDIFDVRIDKKNKPQRPLAAKTISIISAWIYLTILYSAGILISFKLSSLATIIALFIALPLLLAYTPFIKGIPIMGNMVVALLLGVVFLFSEAALTNTINIMWMPAILAFSLMLIREIIKDIEDLKGDMSDNVKTFPVLYGINSSLQIVYFLIVFFCILWWLPYLKGIYGNVYAFLLLLGVEIPLIFCIFFLLKNPTSSGCALVSRAMKWITFNGMITILCSSL